MRERLSVQYKCEVAMYQYQTALLSDCYDTLTTKIASHSSMSVDVGDGWVGWAIAHPDFGKSVNPISQRIAIMSKHISLAPKFFWHFGGPVNATYL